MAEKRRKKNEEKMCTVQTPRSGHLIRGHFRLTDVWGRTIPSNPATVARSVRGEKGGAGIEESLLIRSVRFGTPHLARSPDISYPAKFEIHYRQSRPGSHAPRQHSAHEINSSLDCPLNGSRRLSRHQIPTQACRLAESTLEVPKPGTGSILAYFALAP